MDELIVFITLIAMGVALAAMLIDFCLNYRLRQLIRDNFFIEPSIDDQSPLVRETLERLDDFLRGKRLIDRYIDRTLAQYSGWRL